MNPLLRAAHQSDDERICLLLKAGSDVNVLQDRTPGFTPLQELATWASLETLSLALARGALVNKKIPNTSSTALHIAAACGRTDVVLLLLQHGADLHVKDVNGKTALDWAKKTLVQPYFTSYPEDRHEQGLRETIACLENLDVGN